MKSDKVSSWQKGYPPCDGIWEIHVKEDRETYYARFKNGQWGDGNTYVVRVPENFEPYPPNNDPSNPRPWRGLIETS